MRQTVHEEKSKCTGCGACVSICPKSAIQMKQDDEGFFYPVVNENCVGCNLCETRCPSEKISSRSGMTAFGAYNSDEQVRLSSSSGGVFTALAEQIISEGGIVFGTVMNEQLQAEMIGVFSSQETVPMRGSKYVQSSSAEALHHAAELIEKGFPVMFSGTPCQVAGLYALIGNSRPRNLLTVDFVCHGVPSPGVFSAYLHSLKQIKGQEVVSFSFRDKRLGWKDFSTVAVFKDGLTESGTQTTDPYMRGFLQNLYLRPSCHKCTLRNDSLPADITLGDLWGAQVIFPERDDDKGLSLLLVHSEQGHNFLNQCASIQTFELPELQAFKRFNPSLFAPAPEHPKRKQFMKAYAKEGFSFDTLNRLLAPPGRIERTISRISGLPGAIRRRMNRGENT